MCWAVVYRDTNEIYIEESERQFANLTELFVEEGKRGLGIGRKLIHECEAWAKSNDLSILMVGVLAHNSNAEALYRTVGFEPYAIQLRKRLKTGFCS